MFGFPRQVTVRTDRLDVLVRRHGSRQREKQNGSMQSALMRTLWTLWTSWTSWRSPNPNGKLRSTDGKRGKRPNFNVGPAQYASLSYRHQQTSGTVCYAEVALPTGERGPRFVGRTVHVRECPSVRGTSQGRFCLAISPGPSTVIAKDDSLN